MKTYKIPIAWESYQTFTVDAENLQEAVEKALKEFLAIPDDNYLDDSFSIDNEILEENTPDETFDIELALKNIYDETNNSSV